VPGPGLPDTTCPPRWSRATARALRHHGKTVRLYEYAGQRHAFGHQAFSLLMHRSLRFFARH
jgi:dienelactone hydrolase